MKQTAVKILLVDDIEDNVTLLAAHLEKPGLELLTATSGSDALKLLASHEVALAILDVNMPGMDGFQLAEAMRSEEKSRQTPIIFVTAGRRDGPQMFRGYDVGAVDFLYKPIEPSLLRHKVQTFVELHQRRAEVERLAEDLQNTLRLNEMFVAAVSHDLRSPLSSIAMGLGLLARRVAGDHEAEAVAQRMRSSTSRMTQMLNQLYDLARSRVGGGLSLDRSDVDILACAERVVSEFKLAHPDRLFDIGSEGETVGHWDPVRLEQILANLVGNAVRHGTITEPVRVAIAGAPEELVAEVHNGGEIPPDVLPYIFDPFRSGSPRARDGLGLGLYIVDQIARAHGGAISAASGDSRTVFRLTLPRQSSL